MKRNILIGCALLACATASAQDVLITQNGDVMNVYDVEVGPSSVFYKSENKASAPVLRMDKGKVFVIKRKDGTKYDLGNGSTINEQVAANNVSSQSNVAGGSSQMTATAPVSEASRKRNEEIINQINSANPEYKGNNTDDKCGRLFCLLGLKPGSQMVNDDLEMSLQIGRFEQADVKGGYKSAVVDGIVKGDVPFKEFSLKATSFDNQVFLLKLKNKTSRTLYIDLGNTFIIRNGNASPYYIPTSTSSSTSSGSGASVNLGAVAGALGVGGTLGTLAGGIGVGGGSSSSTVNTTYSQRVVSIPPMSEKSLDMQVLYKENMKISKGVYYSVMSVSKIKYFSPLFFLPKSTCDFKNGMMHNFTEDNSPMNFGFYVSYSYDESCQQENNMASSFYLRRVIGFDKGIYDGGRDTATCLYKVIPDFKDYLGFIAGAKRGKDDDVIDLCVGE